MNHRDQPMPTNLVESAVIDLVRSSRHTTELTNSAATLSELSCQARGNEPGRIYVEVHLFFDLTAVPEHNEFPLAEPLHRLANAISQRVWAMTELHVELQFFLTKIVSGTRGELVFPDAF